jgi:hypothetical protein
MDNETRSWLIGVPFDANESAEKHERPALSKGQKRELARFTGLVMASTVFFLTPLLLSAPGGDSQTSPSLGTIAATQPAPELIPPPIRTRSAALAKRAASAPRARAAVATVAINQAPKAPVKEETLRKDRKGISAGILRALVGSGRYRVQPFPTPTSSD